MFRKLFLSGILFIGTANILNADVLSCDSEFVLGQDTYTYTGWNMTNSSGSAGPKGVCIDSANNRAFVADTNNNRILVWNDFANLTNGKGADVVIGQPDFGSTALNFGGRSDKTLYWPQGIAVDASGNLWVADTANHRVLKFNAPFSNHQSATLRLGQGDFTSGNLWGGSTIGQNNFYNPTDIVFDNNGNLLVADSYDGRILRFAQPFSNNMNADMVLGSDSFTVNISTWNKGSQNNIYQPESVAIDGSGNVWVADPSNHRVIRFDVPLSSGMNANVVIGSTGGFINYGSGVASQYRLYYPCAVAVDHSSNVWVADRVNHRVLRFSVPISSGMNADMCIGHANYTTASANDGHSYSDYYAYPEHLYSPYDVFIDSGNNLWVADLSNRRVIKFMSPSSEFNESADLVLGQASLNSNSKNGLSGRGVDYPYAVAVDTITDICAVTDTNNNRVLYWYGIQSFTNGKPADGVIGQPDFTSAAPQQNNPGRVDNGLYSPKGVAFDASGNLWVTDSGNNRILKFTRPFSASNQSASLVIGQPDMNTGTTGTTQKKLNDPRNICFDASGNLWVADASNCRAIRFNPPFATYMDASVVLGQADFTINAYSGGTQNGLSYPYGVFAEPNGNIWVADTGVHRTLRYDAPISSGMNANLVLGQSNFTGVGTGLNASGTSNPRSVCVDGFGNAWVVDGFSRALRYTAPLSSGMASTKVLGQADFGTSAANRNGTPGRNTLYTPYGMTIDQDDSLWIADTANNRIMKYNKHDFNLVVTSATPNSIYSNSIKNIHITGNDFVQGMVITLKKSGSSNVVATNVVVSTSSQLDCSVYLVGYATGYWDIEATYGGFIDTLSSGLFVDSVRLYSVEPSSGLKYIPVNLTLTGANFLAGTSVYMQRGGMQIPATSIVIDSPTQISCSFTLFPSVTGYWIVYISTGNASSYINNGFFISDIQTTAINPANGINNRNVDCVVNGESFLTGMDVKLQKSGETDISATNVVVQGNNQLLARFNLAGASTGYWDLYVESGTPLGYPMNTHPNMFLVESILLSSMTPNSVNNILPSSFTFFGQNLGLGTTIALTKSGQPNINGVNVVASDTQLACGFDLMNAATGYWDVVVTSGSSSNTFINGLLVNTIIVNSVSPVNALNNGVSSATVMGTSLVYGSTVTLVRTGQTSIAASNMNYLNPAQLACVFDLTGAATGYWNIVVTSVTTVYTLPNALQVNTMKLISVNPPDAGNNLPVVLNVTGENLVFGMTLKLVKSGQTDINAGSINVANSANMTCLIDLTGAATGYWDVVITSGVMTSTSTNGFQVSTNKLSSIAPTQEWNNKTVNVVVIGEGLLAGTTLKLKKTNETDVYAGNLVYTSTSQITGVIDLTGLTTGYWDVVVTSAGMNSTLASGFLVRTIKAESINPVTALNNLPTFLTLTGADLVFGTTLKLTKTGQAEINASNVSLVSATQLTCSVDLSGAATGQWNVVITSGPASSTLVNAFAISTMKALSVTPTLTLNNTTLSITLTGQNLLSGTTMALIKTGQANINASAVTVVSATQLTGSFDLTGAATGYWSVVITSGVLSSSITDTIQVKSIGIDSISSSIEINNKTKSFVLQGDGMFEGATVKLTKTGHAEVNATNVTANDTSLVCNLNLLGLATGYWDIMVTTGSSAATKANALLVKTLILASVTPSSGTNTGSVSVTITGENLLSGATIALTKTGQSNINATAVVVSTDTQAACAFELTGAATGYWNVVVTTGPLSKTLAGAFEIKGNEGSAEQPIDNTKEEEVKIAPPTGEIKVEIPAGTFSANVTLVMAVPAANLVPEVNQTGLKALDVFVEITAEKVSDNSATQPDKAITITMNYRDSDVTGDESKLVIAYHDGGRWVIIPSVAYPDLNKIVGTVRHLTMFRLVQLQPAADLNNVLVYPNPYKGVDSNLGEGVVFAALTSNAQLKVFNLSGELVFSALETGNDGRLVWDTKNASGGKVASGVYIYIIKDTADSSLKAKGKFAIIR
ncbi:MAG: hypothetical protein A2297_08160 [Elusimicrobia bacterium RIFOXYB2_FULL_48_7]|nr:MAG: hypothetical protein A2297_08160 [Elusimicrobia bacterium RIFOXYB2_FULL_48_7]